MLRFIILCLLLIGSARALSLPESSRLLSLDEAISLAIRENPNVKRAQLGHIEQKYALELAKWQFKPQYSFAATRATSTNFSMTDNGYVTENTTGANGTVSLLTPYGTKLAVSPTVNQSDHFHPGLTFEVMQPLLRGFGRPVVEASLKNAIDGEEISRLNVEGALRRTVTAVINAYLDVLAANNNLEVDQQALQRAETSLQQTKLFIKSGRKAGVEIVTVEADVANAKARIENDKNAVDQARYTLLTAIGIDPSSDIQFADLNVQALITKYHVPTLDEAKALALAHDIQYRADCITLLGMKKRQLITVQDNTRWQLNLSGSAHAGDGVGDGPNAGLQSLVNGVNQTNRIELDLVIPIDDKQAKTALVTAKLSLREAEMALQQEKWSKETLAINGWHSVFSAERALRFAENAEKWQKKTYDVSFQKYSHGLLDSLQLQSAQQQLVVSGQALNLAQINYLKALVGVDEMIGRTLETWKVEVRYGGESETV